MEKKPPLHISEKALSKIIEIRLSKQIDAEYALRLGVKSAGCGIASFIIGFDHSNEKDEVFILGGEQIVIEKMQLMYLAGKTVDYGESEDGAEGFVFRDAH